MISVLILTLNEQHDIEACLDSVAWSDDVHVLDSGSTDDTVLLAAAKGAHVTSRDSGTKQPFGGDEAAYRNWSLRNISFKYGWLLQLDADERVTKDLTTALFVAVKNPGKHVAFRVRRRDFFMDTWLRHVQASPFYLRLFRPSQLRYERLINPVSVVDGPIGTVSGYVDHFPFSKGISHWIDKHNGYSTLEAEHIIKDRGASFGFSALKAFVAQDFHERRYHQKTLFYQLPMRPLIKFIALYIIKLGFLDGRAGLTYAVLQSIYEYLIVLKVRLNTTG